VASPFTTPALLGRAAELERLAAELETGESRLVMISGAEGSGKSRLLDEFAALADERGWFVADPVEITPSTGEEDVLEPLRKLTERAPGKNPLAEGDTVGATKAAASVLENLRHPLLVRFDGFHPDPAVEAWLLDTLLPALMARPPVIVAIAERDTSCGHLGELTAERLELGPPDAAALRAHLERLGAELAPPASEQEIATLTAALTERPALIEPLIRALRFARADD
jgi:hypothetical protein